MEILFTFDEIDKVKDKFDIDLDSAIHQLLFLEDLNYSNVFDVLKTRFEIVDNVIKSGLKYPSYTYSSLSYYHREIKRMMRSDASSQNQEEMLSLLNVLLCSIYNHMCYLVEKANYNKANDNILVFEACPSDLRMIRSRDEALKIKNLAVANNINPITRFGTNINAFKNTCNDYRIDYLHFAGHGEGNGDLALVGNDGRKRFLGFDAFEKYFSNEYAGLKSGSFIKNIFLNSCNSDKFANKIHGSHLISGLFVRSVSHHGENPDAYAIEFADLFYSDMFISMSIQNGFDYAKGNFSASLTTAKNEYANNAILV